MAKLILYFTEGCHLCESALDLVQQCVPSDEILHLDIIEDEVLLDRFQYTIPVLEHAVTQQRLCWPFKLSDIHSLLNYYGSD